MESLRSRRGKWSGQRPRRLSCLDKFGGRSGSGRTVDARLKLLAEVLDRTAERLDGARGVSTEGLARPEKIDDPRQDLKVLGSAFAALQRAQGLDAPGQAVAAGSTPAAGLPREELLHIAQQRDHVDRVVHRKSQAGTHPRAVFGDATGIHQCIQVLGEQKAGTGTSGLPALEGVAVTHAAGI